MAETFKDTESTKKILQAPNVPAAEEAVKNIKNYDYSVWDKVILNIWILGTFELSKQGQKMANFENFRSFLADPQTFLIKIISLGRLESSLENDINFHF